MEKKDSLGSSNEASREFVDRILSYDLDLSVEGFLQDVSCLCSTSGMASRHIMIK